MDRSIIEAEHRRLEALLDRAGVPQQQRDVLAPVIDNMAWQRAKLDEVREEMQDASVVCHYCNGGGQEGERENPIFKGYINLWRAYVLGLEKFTAHFPKELQDEAASKTESILDQVRQMKKAKAC